MAIVNGYCTLAEVKSALRLTDNVDDGLIEMVIVAGSFTNPIQHQSTFTH